MNPSLEVYHNLPTFFKHRNLEMVSPLLTDKDFTTNIQYDGYIIIETLDARKDRRIPKTYHPSTINRKTKTYIIIIDVEITSLASAFLHKILTRINHIRSNERPHNIDVIIISENELGIHPKKKIEQFKSNGDENAGFVNIIDQLYTLFISDIFDHKLVPPHRIISKDEEEALIKRERINRSQLPKILKTDVACIIIGAVPDDIIEITRYNENSGLDITYRIVR